MQTYRVKTAISKDGAITIRKLPFEAGDEVEVIVRSHERKRRRNGRYPLRGTPVRYVKPFESVGQNDWDVLQ